MRKYEWAHLAKHPKLKVSPYSQTISEQRNRARIQNVINHFAAMLLIKRSKFKDAKTILYPLVKFRVGHKFLAW